MLDETGMPGVPGAPDEPVFGSTSCVHDLPPSDFSTNPTAGRSTPILMPFASLDWTVVLTFLRVGGTTPPPQVRVRRSESSLRLAFVDAGPSAARRLASLLRAAWPLTEPRIFVAFRVLR